jgi:hypothetical protein
MVNCHEGNNVPEERYHSTEDDKSRSSCVTLCSLVKTSFRLLISQSHLSSDLFTEHFPLQQFTCERPIDANVCFRPAALQL